MMRILSLGLIAALFLLNGCTVDKRINELQEAIKKLEARIDAIEKIVMPHKPPVQQNAYDIPLDDSPVLGNKDAKSHIIVFSNFQCQFCARADKALREIVKNPDFADVNIVFKQFPFDRMPEARPAAKASLAAAEQEKFWEMADKIFSHQNELNEANYKKWAKEIGLNMDKFDKDLKDPAMNEKFDAIIDRDIKEGAAAELEGTPWILVNGWRLEGDITPATIKKMIEEKK